MGRELPPVKPGGMLKIDCDSNSYMEYLQQLGWIVEGIEFLQNSIQVIARDKGLFVKIDAIESSLPPIKLYMLLSGCYGTRTSSQANRDSKKS